MNSVPAAASIVAVSRDGQHRFSKPNVDAITLIEGIGVEGDAHSGTTVQHLSRVARDPSQANLRQVHLIHRELFDEVATNGYSVAPGDMGENVTTNGIDLLGLSQGTRLHLGDEAVIEITGLRNPCTQINGLASGLMKQTLGRDEDGNIVRKAGVMSIVLAGGVVKPGDSIRIEAPAVHVPLAPV
ncbi:MAG TPA: MOSC domain-containing protein [Microbacteriaceae bacterium]|nr:MOSC domain-containing protein [Microbacteriaceae bacterium]